MPTYPATGLRKGPAPIPGQRPGQTDPRYTAPAPRPSILGPAPQGGTLAGGGVGRKGGATVLPNPPAVNGDPTAAQLGMIDQNSSLYLHNRGLQAGAPNFGQSGTGPQARAAGIANLGPNNMPVGIVNGNQTYQYGLQGAYGGYGGAYLADPHVNTTMNATTAAPDWSFGRNAKPATYAAGGAGGGAPGSRFGYAAAGDGGNPRFGGTSGGAAGAYGGNPGGAGGAGGYAGYGGIPAALQAAQDAANADNEARYQEGLGVIRDGGAAQLGALDSGYQGLQGQVSGLSDVDLKREQRRTQQDVAGSLARFYGMGLANTTGAVMAEQGVKDRGAEREQAAGDRNTLLSIDLGRDYIRQQQAGMQANRGEETNWLFNKQTVGPDANAWTNLLSQAGAGGQRYNGYGGVPSGNNGGGGGGGVAAGTPLTPEWHSSLPTTAQNNRNPGYYKPGGAYNDAGGGGVAATSPASPDSTYITPFYPGEGDPADRQPTGYALNTGAHAYGGNANPQGGPMGYTDADGTRYQIGSDGQWRLWDDNYGWVPAAA